MPASTAPHVLLVEDDSSVAEVIGEYLRRDGMTVTTAGNGDEAWDLLQQQAFALLVLDRMLPGIDGIELCRRVRRDLDVPIVMVTALGQEEDRIAGLEVGADDYVTKPFSPRELALRVQAVLRRGVPAGDPPRRLAAAGIVLDETTHQVTRHGAPLALTLREFDLLAFLLRNPGRAFTRQELMERVWGWDFGDLSTVTVHVRRLREKIETDPAEPLLLLTVWGVGYLFQPGGGTG